MAATADPRTRGAARLARAGTPSAARAGPSATAASRGGLLGRDEQLRELDGLLGRERLITLTGAPGIGKSRLALELADRAGGTLTAGAWVVELAPVARPSHVPRVVAAALSVDEQPGQSTTETLVARLSQRAALLVMDDGEHLLRGCAKLVGELLSGCPELRVLVTSREPLAVEGELVWQVPPLPVPARDEALPERLEGYPAVALFIERAAAVQPGFALNPYTAPAVAEITRRLDGIPLAIELAAARVESLTPKEIARRLDDRFSLLTQGSTGVERHQTLAAALDWSYELLSVPERALLRRLSVFTEGFACDAVEAVCAGKDLAGGEAGELLVGLVAKSLVATDINDSAARHRLLETIRAYAADRLEQLGETAALREAHGRHYLALAERAESELTGPLQQEWLARLEVERANLRAAIEWSLSHGREEWALRLSGSLVIFWYVRCHFSEGREILEAALSAGEGEALKLRAKALWGAGVMAVMAGERDGAAPLVEETLAAFSELEDARGRARALLVLGNCRIYSDPNRALSLFEQSAALARQTGDSWCLAHACGIAGLRHLLGGDPATAQPFLEESVKVARDAGDKHSLRMGLVGLGQLRFAAGEYREAAGPLEEAVALAEELGDDYTKGWALQYLGRVFAGCGNYARAREALDTGIGLLREVRPVDLILPLVARACVARAEGEHRLARQFLEEALTLARAGNQAPAPALVAMGELAAEEGDTRSARRLLEEGLDLARASGAAASMAVALHGLGELARAEREAERAAALHNEALRLRSESANAPGIAASLEALAGLAAEAGSYRHASRLLGAARALRDKGGYARLPWEASLYEVTACRVRESLSADELEAAFADGAALSIEESVAVASQGPEREERPARGWSSVTEAERRVAELAAEGLTNRAIAERLFLAPATVKNHLASIFAKLEIARRSELAAEVWRRRRQEPPPGDLSP